MPKPDPASPPGFTLVYSATGMTPVRMLHTVSLAFAVAGTLLAVLLLEAPQQQHISPDGHLAWAALLLAVALAAPVAAWLHGRHLVSRLWISDDKQILRLEEPTFLGSAQREVARTAVRVAHFTPGDASGEKSGSPRRLEVVVDGGRNFTVILGVIGSGQRAAVIEALQG